METMSKINWDCLVDDVVCTPVEFTDQKVSEIEITVPTIGDVKQLDIEEATKLLPWEQVECFKEQTKGFEVVTIDQCKQALSMAMQSRKLSKAVEKKRKEITKPHLDFQKGIKKIADAFIDELKAIEASMTEKVESFNKAREEKSKEIGVDLSLVTKDDLGTSYTQEYWEFKVEDIEKVPIEFLEVNNKAVRKVLSDGVRQIDGLKVFKVKKTRYRVK